MEMSDIHDQNQEMLNKIQQAYRDNQSINLAIMGGTGVALLCSIIWAALTVITKYQIGWMAIGVGAAIGFAVRYFGRSIDISFRIIASILSVLSCLLGNMLSLIWFYVRETGDNFFITLLNLDYSLVFAAMKEAANEMDLLFYAIAVYESYRFSVINISSDLDAEQKLLDEFKNSESNRVRSRLAVVSLCSVLIITILPYFLSSGVHSFKYDTGELLSRGRYQNGNFEGEWKYFYKNGNIMSLQNFHSDLNTGKNIWYHENSNIKKIIEYDAGLMHGIFEMYYENGQLYQKGQYEWDRMMGKWFVYYDNGIPNQEIQYKNDKFEDKFMQYYKNGNKMLECNYNKGVLTGDYQYWDSTGTLIRKSRYKNGVEYLIQYQDLKGKTTVNNGSGSYTEYYPDYTPSETGYYLDSLKTGIWTSYYENGKLWIKQRCSGAESSLIEYYDQNGLQTVINGNGMIETYQNGRLISQINYAKGKIEGQSVFYDTSGSKLQTINYSAGKMNGEIVFYNPQDTTISMKGYYKNDESDGEWFWYHDNGNISSTVKFENGKKAGVQKFYNYYGIHLKNEIYEDGEKIKTEIVN